MCETDPHANRAGHERLGQLGGGNEERQAQSRMRRRTRRPSYRPPPHRGERKVPVRHAGALRAPRHTPLLRTRAEVASTLDVREEKGDGAGWEVLPHSSDHPP